MSMINLVALHNEVLKETSYYFYNYSELKTPLDLIGVVSKYVEGDRYIIPIHFDMITDRYRLDMREEYNLIQTVSENRIIREKFYIQGILRQIIDEFEIDLRDYRQMGLPISEFDQKKLVEDLKMIIKNTMTLKAQAYWNTVLFILRQILYNDTVIIDNITINTPFVNAAGAQYPRFNAAANGINGNWSSAAVDPINEIIRMRNLVEVQDYLVELPIEGYIMFMGQAAWSRFRNNANVSELRVNWKNTIDSLVGAYDEKKFKRSVIRHVGKIEDIDIFVPEERFLLRIAGQKMKFINDNDVFLIAKIKDNFIHVYNTGNYFINENPALYVKPSGYVEIVDITNDTADSKFALRRYKLLGKLSLNVLFTHAIAYLTTS
ncbi:MAG: hypothetical protein NZ839_00550 [Endomicrobia bacterium]|nr:hypothetical protein [Endomicrobiia bacterium]